MPDRSSLWRALAIICLVIGPLGALAQEEPAPTAPDRFRVAPPLALRSSVADFRSQLRAPAGSRGFLAIRPDGHFYWPDGARARFWGVNVSSTRLNVSTDKIEKTCDQFARAGLNLVRLEAIDNRNCLLGSVDSLDSRHIDPQYLDRFDHWISALRRRGICYYVDLLDFRTFKEGDGVANADQLDRGARPYAVFDPYIVALQKEYAAQLLLHMNQYTGLRLVDDPGLALLEICNEHGFFLYPEKLDNLVEPYRSNLRATWNLWLRGRYGTRERIAEAWGLLGGQPALRLTEDPMRDTVDLPLLTKLSGPVDPNVTDVRRTPARLRDGIQFLYAAQKSYFREMRKYLRAIGLRIPVTAVVSNEVIPDLATVAAECDFTAENWYGESVNGDPRVPGQRFYANRNPLRDDSPGGLAPYIAALRWRGKPVVVREWATTWPNRFRASSTPEMLAYASLQDVDAVLLFGFQTNRAPNGAGPAALNDFAFQADPTVWGLTALAGRAFLTGAIRPAIHNLHIAYSSERITSWPCTVDDLQRAAWSVRVTSSVGAASGDTASVVSSRGGVDDLFALRRYLHAIHSRGAPVMPDSPATGVWRSDTGQIARYTRDGLLVVDAPRIKMLAGELEPNHTYALGSFRFSTPTSIGAIMIVSLDDRPLEQSRHWVVKMVTRAENTGQLLERSPAGAPSPWWLRSAGDAPVLTYGRASSRPSRLWVQHGESTRQLVAIYLEDGSWEMDVNGGRSVVACDTSGISGIALGTPFMTNRRSVDLSWTPETRAAEAETAPARRVP